MLASSTFINLWETLQFAGLGNWERGFGKRHEPELQSWKTCISLLHLDGEMLSPFSWTRMPTGGLPWALRSWGPVRWGCFSPETLHPLCIELPISNGTRSGPLTQGSPTKYFCHLKSLFSPFRGFLLLFFLEQLIGKGICIPIFIASLFTVAKTWKRKQHKCLSKDE